MKAVDAASVCLPGKCCVMDIAGVAGERTKRRGDDQERPSDRLEMIVLACCSLVVYFTLPDSPYDEVP